MACENDEQTNATLSLFLPLNSIVIGIVILILILILIVNVVVGPAWSGRWDWDAKGSGRRQGIIEIERHLGI